MLVKCKKCGKKIERSDAFKVVVDVYKRQDDGSTPSIWAWERWRMLNGCLLYTSEKYELYL